MPHPRASIRLAAAIWALSSAASGAFAATAPWAVTTHRADQTRAMRAGDHRLGILTAASEQGRTYSLTVRLRAATTPANGGRVSLSLVERTGTSSVTARRTTWLRAGASHAVASVALRAQRHGDLIEARLRAYGPAAARYEVSVARGSGTGGRSALRVAPASASLAPGRSQAFTASFNGAITPVSWSVDGVVGGNAVAGRITPGGVYSAPSSPSTAGSVVVRATMGGGRHSAARVTLTADAPPVLGPAPAPDSAVEPPAGGSLTMSPDPIRPWNQESVPFGWRSHWMQPIRGYLDTPPAARLRDAVGINFNVGVDEADATARLLAASGIRRARIEIGWGEISYDDPTQLWRASRHRRILAALVNHGIRPLILLNSHDGAPAPRRGVTFTTVADAPAGARAIRLDAASAALVVPRRSGLDALTTGKAAEVIFTSVSPDGLTTLSRPLPVAVAAGAHRGSLLRFEPFTRPLRLDGSPEPRFAATMAGWLAYVAVITREAKAAVGGDAFDIEIWNELTFGSDFLDADRYYDPATDPNPGSSDDDTTRAILERTVAWVRDPAHGVSGIGIGNGFANQRPWEAGSTSPVGLTAIDKHPYPPFKIFPRDATMNGLQPVDALGHPDGTRDASGRWLDAFVPNYVALFPEYALSAIQTETLVRDLSPLTSDLYGTPHGRLTAPAGGTAPEVWITEVDTPGSAHVSSAALKRFQAKSMLRTLVSYSHAGATAIDMYAARGDSSGEHALVDPAFLQAATASAGAYPGVDLGGAPLDATRRLTSAIPDSQPITRPRALSLRGIGDYAGRVQFDGDGSALHPPLYDRDVAAVLPFQVADTRFAVAAYVVTRDMSKVSDSAAPETDPRRYDLPAEVYRLQIGGIQRCPARVTATDPLDGVDVPVQIITCGAGELTIELPLTDSPRVVTVDDA